MNKHRFLLYTKIPFLICVLLALVACGGETVFVVIVVTATPAPEITIPSTAVPASTPPAETVKPLSVDWRIISKNCSGGKLKDATIGLIISGGQPPYTTSPKSPFPITDGRNVEITVKSQDGKTFTAFVPPPTCDDNAAKASDEGEESSSGGGTGSTPDGGTVPTPTPNPNHP